MKSSNNSLRRIKYALLIFYRFEKTSDSLTPSLAYIIYFLLRIHFTIDR